MNNKNKLDCSSVGSFQTISQLFEEQVKKTPNHCAILFGRQRITYEQLAQRVDALTHHLWNQGVKPDDLIIIYAERNVDVVVAQLSVLKAGGTYVPIDPTYPEERIRHILADVQAKLILTQTPLFGAKGHLFERKKIILLDQEIDSSQFNFKPSQTKKCQQKYSYVLYTSGSTGKPKGVLVPYSALMNVLLAMRQLVQLNEKDVLLSIAPITFDISAFDLYAPLITGAKLVLTDDETRLNLFKLRRIIEKNSITIMQATPTSWQALLDSGWKNQSNCTIISTAEALKTNLAKELCSLSSNVWNLYGPTETTIWATAYKVTTIDEEKLTIPIGKPIDNVRAYTLDDNLQPVPVGTSGELYLGGACVATGYLNQPELTQLKFIPDLFSSDTSLRLYRTGDLVRWMSDGNIEYIGRIDDQIKIRGFRIELGEIDHVLMQHPSIAQAVTCVREVGDRKQLETYFIKKKSVKKDALGLQDYIKQRVPSYMVPVKFFEMDRMPITLNGKVDKKQLLSIGERLDEQDRDIKNPVSSTEILLFNLFKKVLHLEKFSVDDNFFALGCDSIAAMQAVIQGNDLGLRFAVRDIFQYPSVTDLAKQVKKVSVTSLSKIKFNHKFSLSPIQEWFFEQNFLHPSQYSQVCSLTIKLPLDVELLERCFQAVIQNHESLNLRFCNRITTAQPLHRDQEDWQQQYVHPCIKDNIVRIIDISCSDIGQLTTIFEKWLGQVQEHFSLTDGPLLSAAVFVGHSENTAKLFIGIHNLVIDDVSWRIILTEIQDHYQNETTKKMLKTFKKNSSYQAWIKAQHHFVKTELTAAEEHFWRTVAQSVALPIDYHRGENLEKYASSISFEFNENETEQLLHNIPGLYGIKLNEILIALLALHLMVWIKQDEIVFDVQNDGREAFTDQLNLSKTVGWFTCLYPVRIRNVIGSIWEKIRAIKEQLQLIPHSGIGYGLLRSIKKIDFNYKADLVFNYWASLDERAESDYFEFEELRLISHPENKRSHLLHVDAVIKNKRLNIKWVYSTHYHECNTIKQLAKNYFTDLRALLRDQKISKSNEYQLSHLSTLSKLESYPLSSLQKGLLFHAIYTPISEAYMVQLVWNSPLNCQLNLNSLKKAWQLLMKRHSVLRTHFIWEGIAAPIQVVQEQVDFSWFIYDWAVTDQEIEPKERLHAFLKEDRQAGFDFSKAPLWRITIIKLPREQYYCIVTYHHILLDGWSLPILIDELEVFYQAINRNEEIPSLRPAVPYSNYIKWQQQRNLNEAEKFWKIYLKGFSTLLDLSVIYKHNTQSETFVDILSEELILSEQFSNKIKLFCRENQFTLNTFFQGAWALLLSHYTQNDDILFGVTLTERSGEILGADQMVGLLVNTLPLRINLQNNGTIKACFKEIQKNFSEIMSYHYTPLTKVQDWSELSNSTHLFDTILVFENYPVINMSDKLLTFRDIKVVDPTHYPLACIVIPANNIVIKLAYDNTKIDAMAVKRLMSHLELLFNELVTQSEKLLYQLNMLTEHEREELLIAWNKTKVPFPVEKTIHQLFEEQAKRTPDNIAVVCENQQLTYRELDDYSNRLANFLCSKGVKRQVFVAVCVERSAEMLIVVLGILKAGGVYVPIDLDYPDARIVSMFRSGSLSVLLTQDSHSVNRVKLLSELAELGVNTINLGDSIIRFNELKSDSKLNSELSARDTAYMVFTSGSTGISKAVAVSHITVTNLITWQSKSFSQLKKKRIGQFASIGFDVSIQEMFSALLDGNELYVVPAETRKSVSNLLDFIEKNQINIMMLPTSLLDLFANEALAYKNRLHSLSAIVVAGEALKITEGIREFFSLNEQTLLVNHYGPSETHVVSSYTLPGPAKEWPMIPSIGKPIDNCEFYVLSQYLQPVPVGVTGELYVAGLSLAQGYLNQPSMTEKNFIPNPFSAYPRLYKTNDLVRWLSDGNLEYIGRVNSQVKIRGFRVELGEVVAQIQKFPDIMQALVVVRETSHTNKHLVAYITTKDNKDILINALKEFVQNHLPNYLVPNAYIVLESFPLTINGKIDQNALPAPTRQQYILHQDFEPPKTKNELLLTSIWSEVLGISEISIHDNFFDLGGNSLLVLQLLQQIRKHFGLNLPIRTLFDKPTIAQLVAVFDKERNNQCDTAETAAASNSHLENLVVLRPGSNDKSPLFLIHPVGGAVFWYLSLANYLNFRRPVFGIQDPGLKFDGDIPFNSVEEMAETYLKMIKNTQPKGPYFIGGASAGGMISFEISRQLLAQGDEVAFVGLFDSWVPHPEKMRRQELFEAVMRRQYNQMHENFSALGLDRVEPLLKLQWQRVQMLDRYNITPLDLKLTLFKASESIFVYQSYESPLNHWEAYSTQPIELYHVPGNHETMFQHPHVKPLAYQLNHCLERVDEYLNAESTLV